MNAASSVLTFENAPVVEMVQGLFFAPISGWDLLDYGLLWQKFSTRYASHEFKQPIVDPAQIQAQQVTVQVADIGKLPVRCWFIDKSGAELLQIQDNCLIRNWRKISSGTAYPGFRMLQDNFAEDFRVFCAFLKERGLPKPDIWKCELTYVDQFVRGTEWNSFADLSKIYRLWRGMEADGPLSNLEFASFAVNYALPDRATRLVFSSQPTVRSSDGKEVMQLTISATGKPASSSEAVVLDWLDRSHDAVIEGFFSFTTPQIQEHWRQMK
jgi:uncharacterized protein (TIGR04255 family)